MLSRWSGNVGRNNQRFAVRNACHTSSGVTLMLRSVSQMAMALMASPRAAERQLMLRHLCPALGSRLACGAAYSVYGGGAWESNPPTDALAPVLRF